MPARQNEVRADQQPQKPQPQKPQAESAGLAEVTRRGFLGMVAGLLPAAWAVKLLPAAAPAPAAQQVNQVAVNNLVSCGFGETEAVAIVRRFQDAGVFGRSDLSA